MDIATRRQERKQRLHESSCGRRAVTPARGHAFFFGGTTTTRFSEAFLFGGTRLTVTVRFALWRTGRYVLFGSLSRLYYMSPAFPFVALSTYPLYHFLDNEGTHISPSCTRGPLAYSLATKLVLV